MPILRLKRRLSIQDRGKLEGHACGIGHSHSGPNIGTVLVSFKKCITCISCRCEGMEMTLKRVNLIASDHPEQAHRVTQRSAPNPKLAVGPHNSDLSHVFRCMLYPNPKSRMVPRPKPDRLSCGMRDAKLGWSIQLKLRSYEQEYRLILAERFYTTCPVRLSAWRLKTRLNYI